MKSNMQPVKPIMVVDLFPPERKQLLELFSELEAEEWEKPTICPAWTVKDIALHLLGDDIGYLSRTRDNFSNPFFQNKDLHEWKNLVKNINEAKEVSLQPRATVIMDQETCWRLFTKGMSVNEARQRTTIEGDQKLGEKLLNTVSIIA